MDRVHSRYRLTVDVMNSGKRVVPTLERVRLQFVQWSVGPEIEAICACLRQGELRRFDALAAVLLTSLRMFTLDAGDEITS